MHKVECIPSERKGWGGVGGGGGGGGVKIRKVTNHKLLCFLSAGFCCRLDMEVPHADYDLGADFFLK